MAVVPLRHPRVEIVEAPQPDASRPIKITIGDGGLKEIEIGSSQPAQPERAGPDTDDFDRNLAEDFDDDQLASLASWLLEGIEADKESRGDWLETADRTAKFLGIKLNDPASAVAGDGTICQTVATCMLEAAMKLWSTSYAELLPVGGPVKVERADPVPANQQEGVAGGGIVPPGGAPPPTAGAGAVGDGASPSEPGQDPVTQSDQAGDDLADALERDMNWYLTVGDRGYYPDTSKMLMQRNLIGLGFKEIYRCPIERKPLSRFVMAQDVIVSGDPAHINEPGHRVTLRKRVAQSVMRRLQVGGVYRDIILVRPTGITSPTEIVVGETQGTTPAQLPRDMDYNVYETACELGFGQDMLGAVLSLGIDENGDEPGYPLPYRVTLDEDSRTVLAIHRNWKRGDQTHRARRRLVKYGFIPGFGFYDWGLIHLVGNPTLAATMLQRSGVDAGILANFPAWAQAQGPVSRVENTVYRPGPGEVVKIPVTAGGKLTDSLMAWPYKEPSAQSMALGAKLEADVKRLAGVIEIPVGEGRIGNTPVGTIMSYIESVAMVPGAVHKADHIAQAEEFELLRELIAEEPEVLVRENRTPARRWQIAEELLSPSLSPQADPNTPSQMHRLLKVQGMLMVGGLPQFNNPADPIANNRAIYEKTMRVLSGEDAAEYTLPEKPPQTAPPPPDPRIVAAQIKAQADQAKAAMQQQTEAGKHQERMAEMAAEDQQRDQDRQSEETRAAMSLEAAKVKATHDTANAAADRHHEVGIAAMGHAAADRQQAFAAPFGQPAGGEKEGE